MPESHLTLRTAIARRTARVGVLGLGYVGLPLARAFSLRGFPVLRLDTDAEKVARLRSEDSYVRAVPPAVLRSMRERGFEATDDYDRLRELDALLMCLPTPLTAAREPDLSAVKGLCYDIQESGGMVKLGRRPPSLSCRPCEYRNKAP